MTAIGDSKTLNEREDFLRHLAGERGLLLVKFDSRDNPDRLYGLIDEQTKIIAGSAALLSIDEVSQHLGHPQASG